MSKLRVSAFSVSLDGYGAGPDQSLRSPLGVGAENLHEWLFPTRAFQAMHGSGGGESGVDDDFARLGFQNIGSWILGRNMFGPIRGPWPDETWRGWWGEEPPYHCPVFVLTHYSRPPIEMSGGTTFHFVSDGIESVLSQAFDAAGGQDVRLGGGANTIRQYLEAGLVDEMHLAIAPVLLGGGEPLLEGLNLVKLGYRLVKTTPSPKVTHVVIAKG